MSWCKITNFKITNPILPYVLLALARILRYIVSRKTPISVFRNGLKWAIRVTKMDDDNLGGGIEGIEEQERQ